ncbi:hypothetical protein BH10PLA2_BH10PLA2_05000 [soil metagenome]
MTQSAVRLIVGAIFTAGLLANLARGDDKTKTELLPAPQCEGCENSLGSRSKSPDFTQSWATANQPVISSSIMRIGIEKLTSSFPVEKVKELSSEIHNIRDSEEAKRTQVKALMNQYRRLYRAHMYAEAQYAAENAQELDPDNYVIGAAVQTSHGRGARQEYGELEQKREDYTRRTTIVEPGPIFSPFRSENEREINRRLDGPVTAFDYHETPLQQILDDLASWSQINIVPDVPALKSAKISLTQPISMKLEGASLKCALKLLLVQAKLTYRVKNDELVITTPDRPIGTFECKVYPVADLLEMTTVPLEVMSFQRDSIQSPEKRLINLVQWKIEPDSWSSVGGPGVIEYFPKGKALVVRHLPDAQNQVSELLDAFRRELVQQKAQLASSDQNAETPRAGMVLLSPNGLKLLGIDFSAEPIGRPNLPPPVPTLRPPQSVNCPVNIPVQPWMFIGKMNPPKPPQKVSLVSPFLPPEPTFRDPAFPQNQGALAQLQTFDLEGDVLIQTAETVTAPPETGSCWVIRSHSDKEKSTFSAQSPTASMECERLTLKGRHDVSLEFVAGKKTVQVSGKDFEAEAESIEFREQEGKLVLAGHAKLSTRVNEESPTVLNAARIVLDCESHEWQASGMGKRTKSK